MPWKIQRGHSRCSSSKPYAVVAEDTGRVAGCHPSRVAAIKQQRALYANEASAEVDILSETESLAKVDMDENKTNGAVAVEDAEEVVESLASADELDADELNIPEVENEPIAWSGPIALEGVPTGDSGMKRYLMPGSVGWRDLPMTLMAQFVNKEGHEDAEVAGRIDALTRLEGPEIEDEFGEGVIVIWGEGVFDSGEAGQKVAGMVGDQVMRGISVDLTDSVWKLRDPESNELYAVNELPEEMAPKFFANELQIALESGKIGAATIVPIPALEDANVAIAAAAAHNAVIFLRPEVVIDGVDAQIASAIEALKAATAKDRYEGYKLGIELGILTKEDVLKAEGREVAEEVVEESEEAVVGEAVISLDILKADPDHNEKSLFLTALQGITDRLSAGEKLNPSVVSALADLRNQDLAAEEVVVGDEDDGDGDDEVEEIVADAEETEEAEAEEAEELEPVGAGVEGDADGS